MSYHSSFEAISVSTALGAPTEILTALWEKSIAHYPVAMINFSSGSSGEQKDIPFHFDTGADYCIFCDEFIERMSVETYDTATFGEVNLQGLFHLADIVSVDVLLVSTSVETDGGGKYFHSLRALLVDDWNGSRLSVTCSKECRNRDEGSPCIHRENGLLGRTAYIGAEASYVVSIDPRTSKTSFDPIK